MYHKGPGQQTFVIPCYMMYYVKFVMKKNGNCVIVIFKKNDGKLYFVSFLFLLQSRKNR